MKVLLYGCVILLLNLTACVNTDHEILRARRNDGTRPLVLSVKVNGRFIMMVNDVVVRRGDVHWNDSLLQLVSGAETPLMTATHTEEYRIEGRKLCRLDREIHVSRSDSLHLASADAEYLEESGECFDIEMLVAD